MAKVTCVRRIWALGTLACVLVAAIGAVAVTRPKPVSPDVQGRIGSLLACQQFAKKQLVEDGAEFESPYRRSEAELRRDVVEQEPGVFAVHDVVYVTDAAGLRTSQRYTCTVQHSVELEWRVLTLQLDS